MLLERIACALLISGFSFGLSAMFVYWLFEFNVIIVSITAVVPGLLFFILGKSKKDLKIWFKEIFNVISSVS